MTPQSLRCSESTELLHAQHSAPMPAELRSAELLCEHVSSLVRCGHVLNRDVATLVAVTHKLELHINVLCATTLPCRMLRDKHNGCLVVHAQVKWLDAAVQLS